MKTYGVGILHWHAGGSLGGVIRVQETRVRVHAISSRIGFYDGDARVNCLKTLNWF